MTFLPLPEAAVRLGVSQSALRRRLRAGTAQGERRPSAGGFTWYVAVPDAAPTPGATPGQPTPTPDAQPGVAQADTDGHVSAADYAASQEAVRRLEAHVASLTVELEARRREVGQLHTLLAQTNQRLLTAAPVADAEDAPAAASEPDRPQTQNGGAEPWPERRRWWQRLVFG